MLVIICTRKVEFPLTDMNILFRNSPAIILKFTWKILLGVKHLRDMLLDKSYEFSFVQCNLVDTLIARKRERE